MKNNFAIGIPSLNRSDLLNPTLKKYFKQFPNTDIYIIDNGDQNIVSRENNYNYFNALENFGVAKSWNYLCDKIFEKHDYALILNDDVYLDLHEEELKNFFKNQTFDLIRCQSEFEMSAFCVTKKCFKEFRFDEAFYPAYFEDRDYLYRLELKNKNIIEHSFINPNTFINSATISPNGGDPSINKNFHKLQKLYMEKWGNLPGNELFLTPFNQSAPRDKIIEIIAVTYDHGFKLKCFVDSIRSQSSDNWRLHIIHDGKGDLYEETKKDLQENGYLDHESIFLSATDKRYNDYGHSLRNFGINNCISNSEYTVITNCDNYYVPEWISLINNQIIQDPDFIVWDCVHNHIGNGQFDRLYPYGLCTSRLKEGAIDMGSAAIKTEIVKKVKFKYKNFNGDWDYFSDCLTFCDKQKVIKIPSILFVHN
jgi:hypothetical protein